MFILHQHLAIAALHLDNFLRCISCLQGLPLRWQQHPHLRMTRYLITYSDLLSTNIELRLRDSGKVSSRDMSASPQNRRKILSLLSPCTTQKVVYKRYIRTQIVHAENRSRSIMPKMSLKRAHFKEEHDC